MSIDDRSPFDRFAHTGETYGARVPADRLSRFLRLGSLAGGVARGAFAQGLQEVAAGRRPRASDLFMTPANAQRVAQQLSRMRGAAMKVGQLLSMDAGDVLPPEIAAILDRLRENADPMPPKQLRAVLNAEWGEDWLHRFAHFNVRPIAAASIGQVHHATLKDGRDLAIKVQYPGIRAAIDSDVDNVSALLRYSGVLPRGLDMTPLLEDAKRQLHEEADYLREADALTRFSVHLRQEEAFRVPRPHPDLSTRNVLTMEFVESMPLTELVDAPKETRDAVAGRLIDLVLKELFEFGEMQTDPNFANYRYERSTGRIVLLDFGATRTFSHDLRSAFRRLMNAGLDRDRSAAREAARDINLFDEKTPERHASIILDMFETGMEALRGGAVFDFGRNDLFLRLRDMGLAIGTEREFWTVPATDTLLVQRKVAGTYLMAARLRARVDLNDLVTRYR